MHAARLLDVTRDDERAQVTQSVLRVRRIDVPGSLEVRQGLPEAAPALHREHTQVVMRIAVVGMCAQHLAIERIGLRETSRLVVRGGLVEQVVQRCAAGVGVGGWSRHE